MTLSKTDDASIKSVVNNNLTEWLQQDLIETCNRSQEIENINYEPCIICLEAL